MDFRVLDFMPDAVVVAASDGNITFVNRAAEALFGYDQGELVGRPVEILIPSRFRAGHRTNDKGFDRASNSQSMLTGSTSTASSTPAGG